MGTAKRTDGPRARRARLVVEDVGDEVVVYDLVSDRAHCLNGIAARVWKRCDGETTPEAIARAVGRELDADVDPEVVHCALRQLRASGLLEEGTAGKRGLSRRDLARRLALYGGLAVLVPVVSSIVAPTPAEAASPCAKAANCGSSAGADCSSGCNGRCICSGGQCLSNGTDVAMCGANMTPCTCAS